MKYIEAEIASPCEIRGHYILRKFRNGHLICEREFENLITDYGLERIGTYGSNLDNLYSYCRVGVGTATPSFTDVQLANEVGTPKFRSNPNDRDGSNTTSEPYYAKSNMMFWFNAGQVVGNLTEVGVGGSAANTLFSRALILDSLGNPTSFPIAADEELQVVYSIIHYPPADDFTSSVDITGVGTLDVTVRPYNVTDVTVWGFPFPGISSDLFTARSASYVSLCSDSSLLAKTVGRSSFASKVDATSILALPYVAGTKKKTCRFTFSPAAGNITKQMLIYEGSACAYQALFSAPLVKSATQTLILEESISWARR